MKQILVSTAMIASLSACGGGSGNVTEIIAMNEEDTVQAALIAGETVTAKSALSNAVLLNWETGSASAIDALSFALKLPSGANEDVTLILDGEEVTFTVSERQINDDGVTYFGWSQDGDTPRYSLWSWSGEAQEGIGASGENYAYVWELFRDNDDDTTYTAYNVIGTETSPDVLATLGTATYEGWAAIKAYPDGSYDGFETVNRLQGDVTMQADFGAGTISGAIDELRWGWTGSSEDRDPIDGSVIMNSTTIAADGSYSGILSPDAALLAETAVSVSEGTYTGEFFGPEADQTAGVISLGFSDADDEYVGSGFFSTSINTDE